MKEFWGWMMERNYAESPGIMYKSECTTCKSEIAFQRQMLIGFMMEYVMERLPIRMVMKMENTIELPLVYQSLKDLVSVVRNKNGESSAS